MRRPYDRIELLAVLATGALLLTPGFVTDAFGFVLLVPPLRQALIHWFIRKSDVRFQTFGEVPPHRSARHHTIEGEYHRDDD